MTRRFLTSLVCIAFSAAVAVAEEPKALNILFLGDEGHHRPAERFRQLQPVLAKRGIDLTYTDKVEALDSKILDLSKRLLHRWFLKQANLSQALTK